MVSEPKCIVRKPKMYGLHWLNEFHSFISHAVRTVESCLIGLSETGTANCCLVGRPRQL